VTEPRRPDTLFWVDPSRVVGDVLTLDAGDSHHLLRVHRAERGAPFEATDGEGTLYRCRMIEASREGARGEVLERIEEAGELPGPLGLLVGLPDARAAESVVEHAVPLGASTIVFIACERSPRAPLGASRLERLRRLAIAGVKQSRRSRLPGIETAPSLGAAILQLGAGARFVADPEGVPFGGNAIRKGQLQAIAAVGPPGGFTREESAALSAAEFSPISLGNNRLTTETATIALACELRKAMIVADLREI